MDLPGAGIAYNDLPASLKINGVDVDMGMAYRVLAEGYALFTVDVDSNGSLGVWEAAANPLKGEVAHRLWEDVILGRWAQDVLTADNRSAQMRSSGGAIHLGSPPVVVDDVLRRNATDRAAVLFKVLRTTTCRAEVVSAAPRTF